MARKPNTAKGRVAKRGKLPDRSELLDFIRDAPGKVGKREIARAFGIKGAARLDLNRLLANLTGDGTLSGNRKGLRKTGSLPPVAVLEVTGRDDDGDLIAIPLVWEGAEGERPTVLLPVHQARGPQADIETEIAVGDRILARITELQDADVEGYRFEGSPIKRLPREKRRLLGIFRAHRQAAAASTRSTARSSAPGRSARATRAAPRTAISCASISCARGARMWRRPRIVESARQPRRPAPDQPHRRARARHPRRLPGGRDRRIRERLRRRRCRAARICARFHS